MLKEWLDEMVEEFSQTQDFDKATELERKVAFVGFLQTKINQEARRERPATQEENQKIAEKTWKKRMGDG